MNLRPTLHLATYLVMLAVLLPIGAPQRGNAEDTKPATPPSVSEEISQLRLSVEKLRMALDEDHAAPGTSSDGAGDQPMSGEMKMGMDGMKKGMGMGDMMKGKAMGEMMEGMGMGGMMKEKGMDMDPKMKGMEMGNMMKGGKGMRMMGRVPDATMGVSALPGFPGASHIYHIGSTGFFLEHQDHVGLTVGQQEKLNKIKETAMFEQNEFDRQIEKSEEELWLLTAEAQPVGVAVEKKLAEIGALGAQQRLTFISAVGEAAAVLTEEQRASLSGVETGKGASTPEPHKHDLADPKEHDHADSTEHGSAPKE